MGWSFGWGSKQELVECILDDSKSTADWGYKAVDESCGPCQTNCPQRLIDGADPVGDGWAKQWRERVKAERAKKGSSTSTRVAVAVGR